MAGVDLAFAGSATSVEAPMERLQALLSRHNIRVAVGRSRWTGQTVIRLLDESTTVAKTRGPGSFSKILAGLVDELAAAARQQ